MFELLVLILSIWLFRKGLGLALKITWGIAKIIAVLLMIVAAPVLIIILLFAGGLLLLLPLAMIAVAIGILKACA